MSRIRGVPNHLAVQTGKRAIYVNLPAPSNRAQLSRGLKRHATYASVVPNTLPSFSTICKNWGGRRATSLARTQRYMYAHMGTRYMLSWNNAACNHSGGRRSAREHGHTRRAAAHTVNGLGELRRRAQQKRHTRGSSGSFQEGARTPQASSDAG